MTDNSNPHAIQKVVVLGGGTAGWLSAAYLQRAFGDRLHVTLVESANIGTIGVGEATVTTLRWTMRFLGFKDEDWMPHCSASYKAAVRFEQWNKPASEGPDYFYHPFFPRHEEVHGPLEPWFPDFGEGISLIHFWHQRRAMGDNTPYAYTVFEGPAICDAQLSPRMIGSDGYEVPTAYHVDATMLGRFLRGVAEERGVERVEGDVVDTQLDDAGYIRSLKLADGRSVEGELFVDCSGFRSVLLGGALGQDFVSDEASLLCDSAVAIRCAHPEDSLPPYTIARGASAGWMWDIPLYQRSGSGYVFSSRDIEPDDAERELREYLGRRGDGKDAKLIRFKPGRRLRPWVKNCVGIGLATGFLEPLESTTIFLIEYGLANLLHYFPDRAFGAGRTQRYNRIMNEMYEEIRDFIILHYVGANRTDTPFWKNLKDRTKVTASLEEQLEFYKCSLPAGKRFQNFVFRERNYTCILDGLNLLPDNPPPMLSYLDRSEADAAFDAMKLRIQRLKETLPTHRQFLDHLHGNATGSR